MSDSREDTQIFQTYKSIYGEEPHEFDGITDYNINFNMFKSGYKAATEQQQSVIAELVEAIDNLRNVKGRHNTEIACNRLYAVAEKVKGVKSE